MLALGHVLGLSDGGELSGSSLRTTPRLFSSSGSPGARARPFQQEAGCGEPQPGMARLPGKGTAPQPPSLSLLASLLGTFPSRSRCPGAAPRGNLPEGAAGACASPALPQAGPWSPEVPPAAGTSFPGDPGTPGGWPSVSVGTVRVLAGLWSKSLPPGRRQQRPLTQARPGGWGLLFPPEGPQNVLKWRLRPGGRRCSMHAPALWFPQPLAVQWSEEKPEGAACLWPHPRSRSPARSSVRKGVPEPALPVAQLGEVGGG